MKPVTPYSLLDDIARDNLAGHKDMVYPIAHQIASLKYKKLQSQRKVRLSALIAVLLLGVLAFTNPTVVNAMKQLLGFIPGIGYVNQNTPVRILEKPQTVTRDGITVTVDKAVADSASTIVVYKVENLFARTGQAPNPQEDTCQKPAHILLPDGSKLDGNGTGRSWTTGYSRRMVFPAIPSADNEVKLVIPCLQMVKPGPTPDNWEIPMKFVAAPADLDIYPVVELPTPTIVPAIPTPTAGNTKGVVTKETLNLVLDSLVPSADSLQINGRQTSTNPDVVIEALDNSAITLTDSSGKGVVLGDSNQPVATQRTGQLYPFSLVASGAIAHGKAALRVERVQVGVGTDAEFRFNLGDQARPGQSWKLDKHLSFGGKSLIFSTISLGSDRKSLTFTIDPASDIQSASLVDANNPILAGSGGEGSTGFQYADQIPAGNITIKVTYISMNLPGPWEVSVDMPELNSAAGSPVNAPDGTNNPTDDASNTIQTNVCLTPEIWRSALKEHKPLPEGLTGKLAMAAINEQTFLYEVVVSNLDGSNRKSLGEGNGPSLSPDGSLVVFSKKDGLHLHNLQTGADSLIAGTFKNDSDPIWSPDGEQFMFTRGPASGPANTPGPRNIMLADKNGNNLRPLTSSQDDNEAMAWMKNGQQIILTRKTSEGADVLSLDINSGSFTKLFSTSYIHSSIALSPDEKQVAYVDMLPGEVYSLFVSNLDGTNKHLVATGSSVNVTHPYWSPDGQWLAATAHDLESEAGYSALVLINPDTCEVVPLPLKSSYVHTWLNQ